MDDFNIFKQGTHYIIHQKVFFNEAMWFGMIWRSIVRYGMILYCWYGLYGYCMVSYGMVGMV